ncbi:hypothetical protein N9M63_00270 [Candidatus Pelagibacter bacterium]|jgi:hypothetical protein|nr:hypothetical protein [Candidatus Pelagibacter bacterium]MDC1223936.1 hypothetical protein [Pelagibacteraceae bacterium]
MANIKEDLKNIMRKNNLWLGNKNRWHNTNYIYKKLKQYKKSLDVNNAEQFGDWQILCVKKNAIIDLIENYKMKGSGLGYDEE